MVDKLEIERLGAADVRHGFFGRTGGVSTGLYASLNCAQGSEDNPKATAENRDLVRLALGAAHLCNPYQIHSGICHTVTGPWDEGKRPEGDALVTDKPGIALGVLTADCAPILMVGRKSDNSPVIAAIHAGWGGAFGGVIESAVKAMEALGAPAAAITAAIGPCIQQKSYEVGAEFYERFVRDDDANDAFFKAASREWHYMFDLAGFCMKQLALAGVTQVHDCGIDTYAAEDRYFSYRRATHRGKPDYGRQMSAIAIVLDSVKNSDGSS